LIGLPLRASNEGSLRLRVARTHEIDQAALLSSLKYFSTISVTLAHQSPHLIPSNHMFFRTIPITSQTQLCIHYI
jgi:hypothetical protein